MTTNTTPSPDVEAAIEWAKKVSASKPPRYTDASRNAANYILALAALTPAHDDGLVEELEKLLEECNRLTPLSLEHECACDELAHFVLIRQQDILTALRASNHTALLKEARDEIELDRKIFRDCDIIDDPIGAAAQLEAGMRGCDAMLTRIDQALAKDSVKGTGE